MVAQLSFAASLRVNRQSNECHRLTIHWDGDQAQTQMDVFPAGDEENKRKMELKDVIDTEAGVRQEEGIGQAEITEEHQEMGQEKLKGKRGSVDSKEVRHAKKPKRVIAYEKVRKENR